MLSNSLGFEHVWTLDDALAAVEALSDDEKRALDQTCTWAPLDGPQLQAWLSPADELFYGGAAGGGKTDFVCGLALEQHTRSVIYRKEATQLQGITDRLTELLGGRDQLTGATGNKVWNLGERQIEYGSMPNPGDEQKQQGRARDLLVFDEITQFSEYQYRYLGTWNRTTNVRQRCRIVVTGNPPTTPEGLWVLKYWGPWLDEENPLYGKVAPGELVYYVTDKGVDRVVDITEEPIVYFPDRPPGLQYVVPRSRSFIPAKVEDNPFLVRTGYANTLEALPEPLRSQMREGDFSAGQDDHEWQVIPSAWVRAAQARWRARRNNPRGPMSAMGVDCSRGGRDEMVCAPRYGSFIDELQCVPGSAVPDGPKGAAFVVQHLRNGAVCNVDVIGVGSSVVDHLEGNGTNCVALQSAESAWGTDKTGTLKFANLRAKMWWNMRELLDPVNPDPMALPPGGEILADLCAPRYKVTASGVLVESKLELLKPTRLGRSPDKGDAIVYSCHDYESQGLVSQVILHAQKDDHFDGPYVRDETVKQRASKDGWAGFNGSIEYPENF